MDEASRMEDIDGQHDLPEDQGDEGEVFLAELPILISSK